MSNTTQGGGQQVNSPVLSVGSVRRAQFSVDSNAALIAPIYGRGRTLVTPPTPFGITVVIPPDYYSIVHFYIWIVANTTEVGKGLTVNTQFGFANQLYNTFTGTQTYFNTINVTAGFTQLIDFPLAFTGIQAGMIAYVELANVNIASFSFVGALLDYLPTI